MNARRKDGRFTRVLNPVARVVRVIHSAGDKEASGRQGQYTEHRFTDLYAPAEPMQKLKALLTREPDIAGKHHLMPERTKALDLRLLYRAPYDVEAMQQVVNKGGLKQLINLMCPFLNAERKALLLERAQSVIHAKQRAHEIGTAPPLPVADKEHRARRLTRSERRAMREGKGKRTK